MTPYEQAASLYDGDKPGEFERGLFDHFQHGYVVSTPDAFALARRVNHDWPTEWLRDSTRTAADGDCWFIWLLAGKLRSAARWLPFPLPWTGYERRDGLPVMRKGCGFITACKAGE
jgi:hypothetical protein